MSELKIKLEINKGRKGVPLKRLIKVADETRKFLEMLGKDIGLGEGEWIAERFKNGSAVYDNTFIGETTTAKLHLAQQALEHVTDPRRTPDDLAFGIRRDTFFQFGRMAASLPSDDVLFIGLYGKKKRPQRRILTKERFLEIERAVVERTRHYGGLQGVITALFKGTNTIWVRDLSTGDKFVCSFRTDQYDRVWELFGPRDAVVNVEGWITHKPGEDSHLEIETITPSAEYQEGDLEKFFGIDPDFTGDASTEEYLDDLRGESTEDYLERLIDE
jgi:hypothetical protein